MTAADGKTVVSGSRAGEIKLWSRGRSQRRWSSVSHRGAVRSLAFSRDGRRMLSGGHDGNLILWDVIFGTRYLPEDREPPEEIGIQALPRFPMGFWANLASPFVWRRLTAEAGEPPRAASTH